MRVFHVAGPQIKLEPQPDGIHQYQQSCTRCGAELDVTVASYPAYTPGSMVERDEYREPDGSKLVVRFTSVPLYDVEKRFRARGEAIPWCEQGSGGGSQAIGVSRATLPTR